MNTPSQQETKNPLIPEDGQHQPQDGSDANDASGASDTRRSGGEQ